ncbi:MAG: hypothetical protein HQK52_00945 [Oligoflexia bacterium]|nr:hypothetical protein [Oligoflexia bacterium]
MKDITKKDLMDSAEIFLEDIILKLQHSENYEQNIMLAKILIDYMELAKFRNNFSQVQGKMNALLDKISNRK